MTAAHLKVDQTQSARAVIGQRQGTSYKLEFREADEATDVALWRLPQSSVCRSSVVMTTAPVEVTDRVIALGFPQQDGITPSSIAISNVGGARGFVKADGRLRPGNRGAPTTTTSRPSRRRWR
ncbi:trypsin-like peptidase domain-containing protein [Rhizobacter sp. Root404]|uniref:trypsin-like peptidase domain-containing protein n=1 Tax=Rhizobacter sp. Root404 TaxID=1736528 RepID=UPI0006F612C3|nr:trypsin-like peptidase domain-containing protein [Rhizobacter sp. Root404]KQW38375.1 hypothetical protein ASC76_10150 [Rhizobacter sp. Root404]